MKKKIVTLMAVLSCLMFCRADATATTQNYQREEVRVVVEEGAVYYESSENFGSGKRAVVGKDNPYTGETCYARITGFSFLDNNGCIISAICNEELKNTYHLQKPANTCSVFVHFESEKSGSGWVDARKVKKAESWKIDIPELNDPNIRSKPEVIATAIKKIVETKPKTAIVVDASGSMYDNQMQVLRLLQKLDLDDNTKILVFGDTYKLITFKELMLEQFDVGEGTWMLTALNKVLSWEPENIILISDLDICPDDELMPSKTLKNLIIYDPEASYYDDLEVVNFFKETWKNANVQRIIIE